MTSPAEYVRNISISRLSIYEPITIGDPELWIPSPALETLLNEGLRGTSLAGLPLRTRSKFVKQRVCDVLGYPRPSSFIKTNPRFPGQNFDTYIQKSNNLQIWNEEVSPTRRYVIIRVNAADVITTVRVVTGDVLALLDTTGTLTQKYQARLVLGANSAELVSPEDTSHLKPLLTASKVDLSGYYPTFMPNPDSLLPIRDIFERLQSLIGDTFADAGIDQERNRGGTLHALVCRRLGYGSYADDGQFPDVKHQLLEVKLQTSPTIDLGLVTPDSTEPLDISHVHAVQLRHCDVRYALFYGRTTGLQVTLTHLFMTTGQDFLDRFPRFGGKVLNKKLQIPLPLHFFG